MFGVQALQQVVERLPDGSVSVLGRASPATDEGRPVDRGEVPVGEPSRTRVIPAVRQLHRLPGGPSGQPGHVEYELSTGQSLAVALVLVLVLAGLHVAAPHVRRLPLVPERATASFAGGLAVAYVFLHLLPEVAEGNEAVGEALSDVLEATPLLDLGIFVVALTGFAIFD